MWIAPAVPALFAHNVPPWASSLTQAAALVGWGGVAELIGIGSRFDLARDRQRSQTICRCTLGCMFSSRLVHAMPATRLLTRHLDYIFGLRVGKHSC